MDKLVIAQARGDLEWAKARIKQLENAMRDVGASTYGCLQGD